jgi:hypothetical protein
VKSGNCVAAPDILKGKYCSGGLAVFWKRAKIISAQATTSANAPIAPTLPKANIVVDDVFSTSEIPPLTFIDRHDQPEIRRLKTAIQQGGKIVCIHGDSKSGKTMFARKQLSTLSTGYVLVEGNRISSVDDFWLQLGEKLKIGIEKELHTQKKVGETEELKAEVSASLSTGIASVKSKLNSSLVTKEIVDTKFLTQPINTVRGKCLGFLSDVPICVILDDFHFIKDEATRLSLAIDLKTPASAKQGKYIIISVPEEAFDCFSKDEQLLGRSAIRPFPGWTKDELIKVVQTGFEILGIGFTDKQIRQIAANAVLNPLNLQQICVNICSNAGIRSKSDVPKNFALTGRHLVSALEDFAEDLSFFSNILKLAANSSGGASALQTYDVGEQRLNVYELALVGLSDAGANDHSGVLISTLRKKIRARVNDEGWTNTHLKSAVERLAAVELDIEYKRAPIPNATDRPLLIVDEKVFVTNPLFRIFLFWCLLPQLGLQNRMPLD